MIGKIKQTKKDKTQKNILKKWKQHWKKIITNDSEQDIEKIIPKKEINSKIRILYIRKAKPVYELAEIKIFKLFGKDFHPFPK